MNLKYFNLDNIESMEKNYRIAFINSLGGFKSIALIGTSDNQGQNNLAIFSSVLHLGSSPPYYGVIIRPGLVERHTLVNIIETGFYTMNHVNEDIYKQSHQTGARYPKEVSEFDKTGLTPEYHSLIKAPYVKESNVKFGLQLVEKIDIKINNTVLLIGKVIEAFIPENCILDDGFIDLEKAKSLTLSGLDSYHQTKKVGRLSYPKIYEPPIEI